MFAIRRVHDEFLSVNRAAAAHAQRILEAQFEGLDASDTATFSRRLIDPFHVAFQTILFVAEERGEVLGFALIHFDRKLSFGYLEFIASDGQTGGRGFGGALYQRLREDALAVGLEGIFFECLPDDPAEVDDPATLASNKARLRFYEHFDARPLIGVGYEMPVTPGQRGLPHLVYDGLGHGPPSRTYVKRVIRALLERKYSEMCSPKYVEAVLACVKADPVEVRAPRYVDERAKAAAQKRALERTRPRHVLVVNDKHDIHHIKERGYVEAPVRIKSILEELNRSALFREVAPKSHGLDPVLAVHDADFVHYLGRACKQIGDGKSVYPYVFPIRNVARPPKDLTVRAGYYCIDTFTPLNGNAYTAARRAVDCALGAAEAILDGERLAYALVRPPGHHAERRSFGGFCYFNNNAIAAHYLSAHGKVAILDIDYHHGNGQQDIFYKRSDVLTVSIHGKPDFAYPYFTGFADEVGEGDGEGFNLNIPLPESVEGKRYLTALSRALTAVSEFEPTFLVVALGLDTTRRDPTGTWSLVASDLRENGRRIGALGLPTVVVQEGGYRSRTLGKNARAFLEGLDEAQRVAP